jgi:beta-lactamase class A
VGGMHNRTLVGAIAVLGVATATLLPTSALAHNTSVATDVATAMNITGGTKGAYLRRIGGNTIYSWNSNFQFEPASAIKVLHAVHAERQIQLGNASVATTVAVPTTSSGSCPNEAPTANQTLEFAIEKMMENSSNEHTEAIKDEFGQAAINATGGWLGAASTVLQHKVGCGGPLPNKMTLADAGRIYEEAFTDDTVLAPTRRQHMWERMNRSTAKLVDTAQEEAMAHWGVAAPAGFLSGLKAAYKPGRYTICTNNDCSANKVYRALAGYVEVPAKTMLIPFGSQAVQMPQLQVADPTPPVAQPAPLFTVKRRYVFGIFIHGAPHAPDDLFSAEYTSGVAQDMTFTALFRGEIKAALDTWL